VSPAVVSCGAVSHVHSALYLAETFFFQFLDEQGHVMSAAFAVPRKIENCYNLHDNLGYEMFLVSPMKNFDDGCSRVG